MTDRNVSSSASAVNSAAQRGDYQATMIINSAPDVVFDALTTTKGLSGWWSETRGSGTTGGELVVRVGDRHKYIQVDETVSPSCVRWTVRKSEPSPEWAGTTITFELTAESSDQSRLHVRHHGLTPALDCYGDCSAGWAFVLGSLANYVETGQGQPFSAPGNDDSANG